MPASRSSYFHLRVRRLVAFLRIYYYAEPAVRVRTSNEIDCYRTGDALKVTATLNDNKWDVPVTMNKFFIAIIAVAALLAGVASSGWTQVKAAKKVVEEGKELLDKNADRGPGVRLGAGVKPEQFVAGFRFGIEPKKPPRIVPSVDFGFGGDMFTMVFNIDFIYRLRVEGTSRVIYGGAGPMVAFLNPHGDGSRWELGLSVVAGMRLSSNFKRPLNLEGRFGVGDIPDLRLLLVIGL